MRKFELTNNTIEHLGRTLYQIKCIKPFGNVKFGDLGGWIEKEENLSQKGNCWVYDNAKVFDDAFVHHNAKIFDNAQVYDEAHVDNNAKVYEDANVYGTAYICEHALVHGSTKIQDRAMVCNFADVKGDSLLINNVIVDGNALINGDAVLSRKEDFIVFKNWWSSGRYFTWTRSNNMWSVGCFYGTGEDLIRKAYLDSENSGRNYEKIVNYVNSILQSEKIY